MVHRTISQSRRLIVGPNDSICRDLCVLHNGYAGKPPEARKELYEATIHWNHCRIIGHVRSRLDLRKDLPLPLLYL